MRRPLSNRQELHALHKAEGGLIRASLAVDTGTTRIKSILITGDFFAYPKRAIFDLEARLKEAFVDEAEHIIQDFFAKADVHIPGVTAHDIALTVNEALGKLKYAEYGLALAEANSLFTVVQPWRELGRPSFLLLPYCAKLRTCEDRYQEGCSQCGLCSFGQAYALAGKYGLEPISIQNYEMLEETLIRCRAKGARSFIGSCCQAFYAKHRSDFERIGLPGVLIDVDSSSCYELGEEDRAYQRRFENQTQLKLGLMEWVVSRFTSGRR